MVLVRRSFALAPLLLMARAASGQTAALPAQLLGADDLILLTVSNSPELTHQFRISPDGNLRLPLLANPIPARRRSPQEVIADIREALKSQHLLVDPTVDLAVLEYASRPVTVMGAVRKPTTFQANAQTTLLEALAKAEGVAPEAGGMIFVSRPDAANGEEVMRVPVRSLLEDQTLARNIKLYGGEQIRVPEAAHVFVLGNVKKSCVVPIKDQDEMTVLRVLTHAEGLGSFSSGEGIIYRRYTDGPKGITIDVKSILKGKAPDLRLQPYDVLYLPESKGKRLTAEFLDRLAGFGSSTVSGYLIFRK